MEVKIESFELAGTHFEKGSHLRTDVETAALLVGLGDEVRHQLGVLVEQTTRSRLQIHPLREQRESTVA